MSLRLSTVILPYRRWHEGGRSTWTRAEQLGFHTAYTYDHLSWRSFRDGPWFGAVPTLTAAASVTERLRLGTLVTSPNFRHPVTLAKELISLDDISGGRITLGIGAGGTGFDATALGQEPWTPRERADRFGEFLPLLDRLLTEDAVSYEGDFYSAHEARNIPGCVQRPRLPFAVAATGPRGLALAARHGQAWVTTGDPKLFENGTPSSRTVRCGSRATGWPTPVPRSAARWASWTGSSSPASRRSAAARWSPWTRSWTSPDATATWASPSWSSTGRSRTRTSPRTRRSSSGSRWRHWPS